MEARTIWILDRATNTHVKIITDATTFGELKQAAKAAGVHYEGKDWLERISQQSPLSDESILPTNLPWQGKVTNDLVFVLTDTNKKIKSGLGRNEILEKIRDLGLQQELKLKYGKPYTNISNDVLLKEVEEAEEALNTDDLFDDCDVCHKKDNKYNSVIKVIAALLAGLPKEVVKDIENYYTDLVKDNAMHVVKSINFSKEDFENFLDF